MDGSFQPEKTINRNEPFKVYSQGSVKISFPDCVSPASGEWHITQTCLLRENHIQANRIIVSSGAILMIDSGVMLELDSEDYEIKVEKGSLVKIFQGGKLKKTVVNQPPYFEFVTPTTEENLTSTGYTISWFDNDFREDAMISLYYDTNKNGFDGTLIVENLSEDSEIDEYFWDLSEVNDGIYFIYAVISDGVNSPVQVYSSGSISTFQNICTPPTSGDWTLSESCTLLENTDISANVFVQSGAVLTIESGATLDLDFLNYQFYGEEHSFLNVKEGGSME